MAQQFSCVKEALQGVARVGRFGILTEGSSSPTAKNWLTHRAKLSTMHAFWSLSKKSKPGSWCKVPKHPKKLHQRRTYTTPIAKMLWDRLLATLPLLCRSSSRAHKRKMLRPQPEQCHSWQCLLPTKSKPTRSQFLRLRRSSEWKFLTHEPASQEAHPFKVVLLYHSNATAFSCFLPEKLQYITELYHFCLFIRPWTQEIEEEK